MKIFNVEDNKEKIYVQLKDIKTLLDRGVELPLSIKERQLEGTNINDNNRYDFVEFVSTEDIKFFNSLEWIINWNYYKELANRDILDEMNECIRCANIILNDYYNYNVDDDELKSRYDSLKYKIQELRLALDIKNGEVKIDFPIAPDMGGFVYTEDDSLYIMKHAIDMNKLLVFRKDGNLIGKDEQIPSSFVNNGLNAVIMENEENLLFDEMPVLDYYLSDDGKYYIIDYKFEIVNNICNSRPIGFMKRLFR